MSSPKKSTGKIINAVGLAAAPSTAGTSLVASDSAINTLESGIDRTGNAPDRSLGVYDPSLVNTLFRQGVEGNNSRAWELADQARPELASLIKARQETIEKGRGLSQTIKKSSGSLTSKKA